jgi:3-methyladenine DNA glycosylase AlkD
MSQSLVAAIIAELEKVADPAKAPAMQAYMKTEQPFYGVQAGPRRKAFKAACRNFKTISRQVYEETILTLWQGQYREELYQALEVAEHYRSHRTKAAWPLYERAL